MGTILGGSSGSGGLTSPVDATDIADGTVSSTEFQYLDGVTSNIQTQIDGAGGGATSIIIQNGYNYVSTTTTTFYTFETFTLTGGKKWRIDFSILATTGGTASTGIQLRLASSVNPGLTLRASSSLWVGQNGTTVYSDAGVGGQFIDMVYVPGSVNVPANQGGVEGRMYLDLTSTGNATVDLEGKVATGKIQLERYVIIATEVTT